MHRRRHLAELLVVAVLAAAALASGTSAASQASPRVLAVRFSLEVNPVTQDYLSHQIKRAAREHYDAVVILLDTPGGLSESMRKIVQSELASPVPIIVYVSPRGARAASAGVWITEAADLAVMGPETNIGSSTPIDASGANVPDSDLRRKVINDAAASLRSLAASHGRNAKWADAAVRRASNLTEQEALQQHVVDLVAPSLTALFTQAEGFQTKGPGRHFTLHLSGAQADRAEPGFMTRLLNVLIDPNLISLLFLAGIAGIGFEVFHPGVVLPGALGGVALVIALFGFSVLPTDWAGLALVLLGMALFVVDAHVISHGALTLSGLVSLVAGLLLLFHNAPAPYHTSLPLVLSLAVALGLFWAFALSKAVQVRRSPVTVGPERLVGEQGVVRSNGMVFVHGELWQAESVDGGPLEPGARVQVETMAGLKLTVVPIAEVEEAKEAKEAKVQPA